MILDPPPKPRRRVAGRLLWPVLIALAVVVAVVVSAAGDQTRVELEYLEEVRSQASDLAKGGDALRDVVSRLPRIGRLEFVTAIEQIREELQVASEFVEAEPPTERLLPVRALYREAVRSWTSGVNRYASSVLTAADDPANTTVLDSLANALADLRAGDAVYADLRTLMEDPTMPEALGSLPPIVMMPAEGGVVSLAAAYIDSARSENNSLALRPGLEMSQLVTDPAWEVTSSGQVVLPATDEVVFSAVVTNSGNVIARAETILLTLTGGPETIRLRETVEALGADARTTVTFDAVAVQPGEVYEVMVGLVVTGDDADLADNEIRVQFTVNEE